MHLTYNAKTETGRKKGELKLCCWIYTIYFKMRIYSVFLLIVHAGLYFQTYFTLVFLMFVHFEGMVWSIFRPHWKDVISIFKCLLSPLQIFPVRIQSVLVPCRLTVPLTALVMQSVSSCHFCLCTCDNTLYHPFPILFFQQLYSSFVCTRPFCDK